MLQSPCPRCGEPSEDGLCGRCAAYLLRFDPFAVRPGIPGPPIDRELRRGTVLLPLNPAAPLAYADPRPRKADETYAIQFLNHVRLPDGGRAVLTRGDRETLQRLLRLWARAPPRTRDARAKLMALYAEAASLPRMPPLVAERFRGLAGIVEAPVAEEIPEPEPEPESEPEPEPEPDEPEAPTVPAFTLPLPPPPPDLDPHLEQRRALEALTAELAAKKDELARWLDERRREMERQAGTVESRLEELHRRESQIADEEARLREKGEELHRQTKVAGEAEAKRSLFFLLFSMEGVGRDAAKSLAEAFGTEQRIRSATVGDLAAVPGVPPEQAALIRDAFGGTGPARRDLREKAEEMLEEQQYAEALEVFDELVRLNPEDVEAWVNRGEVLAILGRTDDAIASYERALAIEPNHRAARSELANLLFEVGDYGPAAATLQELLKQAPENTHLWLARAGGLLSEGKATEATLVYNAVLEADPTNLTACLALGDLLLAMGDTAAADREYMRALQHHPNSPEALLKKGLLLNRQGRWGAAIQLFNRAVSLRWDYREAWAAKGQVLLSQGKPKDALECFEKLLAFDEKLDDAWLGKAEAHLALGENDKAAEAAGRALALDEGNKDVLALLDRLRDSADRPKESVEVSDLPTAWTFDAGVLVETGDALLDSGDTEGAIRAYNEVLSHNPEDASAWFGKGRALHSLERYGEAVRCFTTAVELSPAEDEYRRWLSVCEERWRKEGG